MKQAEDAAATLRAGAKRFGFALFHGWLELLTVMPVLIVAGGILAGGGSSSAGWGWLAGLAGYTFWPALIASVPCLRRTGVLMLCNAAAVAGWGWMLHGAGIRGFLSAAAGTVLAVRATQLVRFGGQERMPAFTLWGGLAACAPAAFIVHRAEGLAPYGDGLAVIGGCLFTAALFLSNGTALAGAAYDGRHVSVSLKRMRRFNRLLVAAFGLPVFAVSFWGVVDAAVRRAASSLLGALARLLPKGREQTPVQPEQTPPPTQQDPFPIKPDGEPAWFWVTLEWLFAAALAAGAAAALFLLLRAAVRRMPGWIRTAAAWLAKYRSGRLEEDTGYVDEVSSTRGGIRTEDPGPWARLKRLFRPQHKVRWEELRTNGERIRYLYALAVRKSVKAGFRWKPQWTPAETAVEAARVPAAAPRLDAGLCEAYERARYGGREPEDVETARWRRQVEE